MIEVSLPELGYFTKCGAAKIAKALNGKMTLGFEVTYGGTTGNYVLNVGTEKDVSADVLKWEFISYAFVELADRV